MQVQDSGQAVKLVLAGEDGAENPAPLDPASVPAYSLDDTSLGSLAADTDPANPLGQIFTPSGKLGTVNVSVSVPAVNAQPALAGTLPVSIVAGSVTQLSLSASVISLSPAPAAPAAPSI
jgi:hypothetical protein